MTPRGGGGGGGEEEECERARDTDSTESAGAKCNKTVMREGLCTRISCSPAAVAVAVAVVVVVVVGANPEIPKLVYPADRAF